MHTSLTDEDLHAAAQTLCGAAITACERIGGGGNNRIYRVTTSTHTYALKAYPSREHDPRDRLAHEYDGLAFVSARLPGCVPAPVAADRLRGLALYSWIDGTRPATRTPADIATLAAFAGALHGLRGEPVAAALPAASEAILGNSELLGQIDMRLARLQAVALDEPGLAALLSERFEPAVAARRGLNPDFAHLAPAQRTLSPSDFGFHNALRGEDGSLTFIDFEYFGWDDPVKLVSDVLWHPGMALGAGERAVFATAAAAIYGADPAYAARLAAYGPLIGLRWVAIVLNEYLPEVWERRVYAGQRDGWVAVKERQLAKAGGLLDRLAVEAG
jgi:hypothetical protein